METSRGTTNSQSLQSMLMSCWVCVPEFVVLLWMAALMFSLLPLIFSCSLQASLCVVGSMSHVYICASACYQVLGNMEQPIVRISLVSGLSVEKEGSVFSPITWNQNLTLLMVKHFVLCDSNHGLKTECMFLHIFYTTADVHDISVVSRWKSDFSPCLKYPFCFF